MLRETDHLLWECLRCEIRPVFSDCHERTRLDKAAENWHCCWESKKSRLKIWCVQAKNKPTTRAKRALIYCLPAAGLKETWKKCLQHKGRYNSQWNASTTASDIFLYTLDMVLKMASSDKHGPVCALKMCCVILKSHVLYIQLLKYKWKIGFSITELICRAWCICKQNPAIILKV